MKTKIDNQKIAIKLANQYAESYKVLELENKTLRKELEDLQTNLSINKSMIVDMINPTKLSSKDKIMIDGLKAENSNLASTLTSYKTENADLKRLLTMNQSNLEPLLNKSQKMVENLTNKVFVLENSITKKDNQIKQLNTKIDELVYNKIISGSTIVQEIAVIKYITYQIVDPNKTTILIHEDLLLYKHVYEQMTVSLRENLIQLKQMEEVVDNLRAENAKYHNLFNNIKASALKDQKYLISKVILI